jgi:hypothetical protein
MMNIASGSDGRYGLHVFRLRLKSEEGEISGVGLARICDWFYLEFHTVTGICFPNTFTRRLH